MRYKVAIIILEIIFTSYKINACTPLFEQGEVLVYESHREINYKWQNDGAILSGTLYLPLEKGIYPAAIWIHGSTNNLRKPYIFNSNRLVRHYSASTWIERGYAFFSYDKRGNGKSTGVIDEEELYLQEIRNLLASDAISALKICAANQEVNFEKTGFFGESTAGAIIPIAANNYDCIAFSIIINGLVVPYWVFGSYSDMTGNDSTDFYFTNCAKVNFDSIYSNLHNHIKLYPEYDELLNPKVHLVKMNIPAFFIQGLYDLHQPARISAQEIREIIDDCNKNWELLIFPKADHALTMNNAICALMQGKTFDYQKHYQVDWETPTFKWLDTLLMSY